jgi:hypothetical protein
MWVYIPGMSPASAPDTEGQSSGLDWWFQAAEQSLWWRGKHSSSTTWRKRWNKVSWTKRLFSRMCEPSTANLGAESWIASLRATRASPSQSPASVLGPPIHATYGLLLPESLMRHSPPTASLKMLTTICASDSMRFRQTWTDWVTSVRREYSVRLRQGLAMYGKGSTFSPSAEGCARRSPQGANASQGPKSAELMAKCEETGQSEITLTDQTAHWRTPMSRDWRGAMPDKARPDLNDQAGSWARPRASNTTGPSQGRHDIQSHASLWGPPKACEGTNPSGGNRPGLTAEAGAWGPPCADDTGTRSKKYSQGGSPLSLQADLMMKDGDESLNPAPSSRRLNPRFEEWLMRVPIGWLVPMKSGLSETELTLWCARWRSRLFGTD